MVVPATVTGQAGAEQRLARDVAAGRALLQGRAHHHVLDLLRIDLGARDGLADGVAEQGRALGGVERAAIGLADRRAGGGNDDGVGQERPPDAVVGWIVMVSAAGAIRGATVFRPACAADRRRTRPRPAIHACRRLPASCARSSSSENGFASGLSLMKAFAASPRYWSGMPSTITSCTPDMV